MRQPPNRVQNMLINNRKTFSEYFAIKHVKLKGIIEYNKTIKKNLSFVSSSITFAPSDGIFISQLNCNARLW